MYDYLIEGQINPCLFDSNPQYLSKEDEFLFKTARSEANKYNKDKKRKFSTWGHDTKTI